MTDGDGAEGTAPHKDARPRDLWADVPRRGPPRPRPVAEDGEPRPYVHVRGGLEARIERSVFYELVEAAERDANGALGVRSGGVWFELGRDH